jgi:alkane 1-monooxygenase
MVPAFFANLLVLTFALCPVPGLILGGPWLLLSPVLALGVFPFLDLLLRPTKSEATRGKPTPLLYLYLPYHAVLILWGAERVKELPATSPTLWLTAFSIGIVTGGIGITFAHEWVHKLKPAQKLFGEWLLVWVGYGHYATEHVYGHHKHVATFEDPATARRNEWIQAYIPRALVQVWQSAFRIKPKRTLLHGLATLIVAAAITALYGTSGLTLFAIQAAVAVLLLASIDYIEHYGLIRKKSGDGRAESVKPHHSWDSDSLLMGEVLIHIQRHADHHMRPLKAYPDLELLSTAPQLPTGYAGMIWLAWWPHLFFRVMNPRLDHSLKPFRPNAWSEKIELDVQASRASAGIQLRYRLHATDPALLASLIPTKTSEPGTRRDELWKTTCFEAFIGQKNSEAYFEFNASPAGDWAWYAFEGYRNGMRKPELAANAAPKLLERRLTADRFEMTWLIPYAALGAAKHTTLSPTAVLDHGGDLAYYSIKHAGNEANFHLRESFIVRI